MSEILIPVIIVAVIGLICGIGLSVASKIFAVPVDEKQEAILECLPGANCGGCGFSGCEGYAAALASGETADTSLCVAGGDEASSDIAAVLGISAVKASLKAAVVMCQGNNANVGTKLNYIGVDSCKMAVQLFGGPKDCTFGCLGMGDCVEVCEHDAIFICDGVARVNPNACIACGKCTRVCPRGLIEIRVIDSKHAAVFCKNQEKGAITRKNCKQGCVACGLCAKKCPVDAIKIDKNLAHVEIDKCIGCGACAEACPTGALNMLNN